MSGNVAWRRWVRQELKMKKRRMTIFLLVTVVLLVTTVLMAQIKSTQQTPVTTPDHQFLVSLTPEAIPWKPLFEGAEMAVLSGDPHKAGSPYVIRRMSFA